MKLALAVLALLAFCFSVSWCGEILQFPLSNALGDYPRAGTWPSGAYVFYDTVAYKGPKARVLSVRTSLTGEIELGLLSCCISYICPDTVTWAMSAETWAKRIGDPGELWNNHWAGWTQIPDEGSYIVLTNLISDNGFTILGAGDRIVVRQSLAPDGHVDLCSEITPAPTGLISGAYLLLDVEYLTPVEDMTWGGIKALYN